MIKRIIASLAVGSVAVLGLTACEPPKEGSKGDKVATSLMMNCQLPTGYGKAGRAAIAGKGKFYGCRTSKSEPCKVWFSVNGDKKKEHLANTLRQQGFFNIPKSAKSWRSTNCKIYKKGGQG